MRHFLLLVAGVLAMIGAPQGLQAKSKKDIQAQTAGVVNSHRREAVLIYNWLKHTPELSIHRMRGATQNVVYTRAPGHNVEAVYDGAGNLVRDGMNMGTYNHYPYDQPLNHFMYDILPWTQWGASKTDPTSQQERIAAYVEDLGRGLSGMRKAQAEAVDLDGLKPHEIVVLAMFIGAIEDGGAQRIYGYLADPALEISPADAGTLGGQLEKGLAGRLKDFRELGALTPRLPKR